MTLRANFSAFFRDLAHFHIPQRSPDLGLAKRQEHMVMICRFQPDSLAVPRESLANKGFESQLTLLTARLNTAAVEVRK